MAPFVEIYEALITGINQLGIDTFSASQDVPHELPVARVQLLNGDSTNAYQNAREYNYPFQIDVVTGQNELAKGLDLAYKVMQLCRTVRIDDYVIRSSEPSLSSMVDTSTNRVLNRQIIRVSYTVIEDTAF